MLQVSASGSLDFSRSKGGRSMFYIGTPMRIWTRAGDTHHLHPTPCGSHRFECVVSWGRVTAIGVPP